MDIFFHFGREFRCFFEGVEERERCLAGFLERMERLIVRLDCCNDGLRFDGKDSTGAVVVELYSLERMTVVYSTV